MEKELARQKVELTGKRHEEAIRKLESEPLFKESTSFTKNHENRRVSQRYALAGDVVYEAQKASWEAMNEQNELYLHSVSEAWTQTDGTGLTG
jgi:hypothetical protein